MQKITCTIHIPVYLEMFVFSMKWMIEPCLFFNNARVNTDA